MLLSGSFRASTNLSIPASSGVCELFWQLNLPMEKCQEGSVVMKRTQELWVGSLVYLLNIKPFCDREKGFCRSGSICFHVWWEGSKTFWPLCWASFVSLAFSDWVALVLIKPSDDAWLCSSPWSCFMSPFICWSKEVSEFFSLLDISSQGKGEWPDLMKKSWK